MIVTYSEVDLADFERSGHPPGIVVPRNHAEHWYVSAAQIRPDRPVDWSHHYTDSHLFIPCVPYLVSDLPEIAMGFAMGLGCQAMLSMKETVLRLHLVVGTPLTSVERPELGTCLRVFLGLAFHVERP